jgi:hypothetical protein
MEGVPENGCSRLGVLPVLPVPKSSQYSVENSEKDSAYNI